MVRLYHDVTTRDAGKHPDYMTDSLSGWRSLLNSNHPIIDSDSKCRDYSVKFVTEGLGLGVYPGSGSMAIDLSALTYMLAWLKSDKTDDIQVRLKTDDTNYKYKNVSYATSGDWELKEELLSEFSDSNSPDLSNITEIELRDAVSGYRVVKLDLLCFANRYIFDSVQRITPYKPIRTPEQGVPGKDGSTLQQLGFSTKTIQIDATIVDDTKTEAQLLDECDSVDSIHHAGTPVIFHDINREITTMTVCEIDDYRPPPRVAGDRRRYPFSARYKENTNRD